METEWSLMAKPRTILDVDENWNTKELHYPVTYLGVDGES